MVSQNMKIAIKFIATKNKQPQYPYLTMKAKWEIDKLQRDLNNYSHIGTGENL